MDILKNISPRKLGIVFILFFFCLTASESFTQDLEKVFSASYIYEKKGDYASAIIEIMDVYVSDSYQMNTRLGWLNYLAGNFTESRQYYGKSINLKPGALEPKFGYANTSASLGNWDDAMEQYFEILKIDPNNTFASFRLGMIYYNREDYSKAFALFEKVANFYPLDFDSNLMLGWTYWRLGKNSEAKEMFKIALLISPGNASANEGLSLIK
ncbi:MAG: tetratricopeptide repeat protein [Ignavibacteria bacterium]|nr:tetratricopeptide repeat protein [Ignavibacteria bacterium]